MCKTPFASTREGPAAAAGHGSLAASWTRLRDPGRVAEAVVVAALGVLFAWAVLFGGGSRDGALATAGIAAIACATVGVAAALRGALPLPRLDRAGAVTVAATALLTLWAGVSIAWSIASDLSWEWLARGLVYTAFLTLGILAGALGSGTRRVAALAAIVLAAALGWALLGVAVPSLFPDGDRIARLREPVGYWNALALLADAALALGLWAARDARRRGPSRRLPARLCRRPRPPAHAVAGGRCRGLGRARPLAPALGRALVGRPADRARRDTRARRRRLGLHQARARRGRGAAKRPSRRRARLRRADGRRRARRRLRCVAGSRAPARGETSARPSVAPSSACARSPSSPARSASSPRWATRRPGSTLSSRGESASTSRGGSPTSARTTGSSGGARHSTSPPTGRWAAPGRHVRARPAALPRECDSGGGAAQRPAPAARRPRSRRPGPRARGRRRGRSSESVAGSGASPAVTGPRRPRSRA